MDIVFYRVLDIKNFLLRFLAKLYEEKKRVLCVFSNQELLQCIDDELWSFRQLSFFPHGSSLDSDVDPLDHPIWLRLPPFANDNMADCLVIVDECVSLESILQIIDQKIVQKVYFCSTKKAHQKIENALYWVETEKGWSKDI